MDNTSLNLTDIALICSAAFNLVNLGLIVGLARCKKAPEVAELNLTTTTQSEPPPSSGGWAQQLSNRLGQ